MASINRVEKKDYIAQKINYTSRDYTSILDDLINSIPGITKKWETSDINDPGMALVKLMAILGDMLNYTQDMQSMEIYPNTVTLRKNAASIYKLIGYKMKWYRSAIVQAKLVNTYSHQAYLPRFCTFTTDDRSITYTNFNYYDLPSNMDNNGTDTTVELIQGIPVTPIRNSGNPFPEVGASWHSVYGYNYTTDDITSNNRIYLPDTNIDQDHLILVDDNGNEWIQEKNIYLTTDTGRFFEFDVDVNDKPYIELIDYWKNYNVHKFKLFYIKSLGKDGEIYTDTLKSITGEVWSRVTSGNTAVTYNVSSYVNFTHSDSTFGYNPETPDEARKESIKYINTLDTLITLADFERAVLRIQGVANVRATDLTNDPGIRVSYYIGDINQDGVIDEEDAKLLDSYLNGSGSLTPYQIRLADCNQDGRLTTLDLTMIRNYINKVQDSSLTGLCGKQMVDDVTTLKNFVVKLYILRFPELEYSDPEYDEAFEIEVKNALEEYKILPLQIEIDLHSIKKYYWTLKGTFITTEPLTRDELQTLMININNEMKFRYSPDKVNFNEAIQYRDVIETILKLDNRILMVDLEPITYSDDEGSNLSKEDLVGKYNHNVTILNDENELNNLVYNIALPNVPVLPGSVMIKIDNEQYILRDNNNGVISNSQNRLTKNGKINYQTGEIHLELAYPAENIVVSYTKNQCNVATYINLSTQNFFFDSSSLKPENTYNLF